LESLRLAPFANSSAYRNLSHWFPNLFLFGRLQRKGHLQPVILFTSRQLVAREILPKLGFEQLAGGRVGQRVHEFHRVGPPPKVTVRDEQKGFGIISKPLT